MDKGNIERTHITIEELKSFLPQEYLDQKKAIFKNSLNEIVLQIKYEEDTSTNMLNGDSYTTENFNIELSEENNPFPILTISGSGHYDVNFDIVRKIHISLSALFNSVLMSDGITFDKNGNMTPDSSGEFIPSLTLGERVFLNCYTFGGSDSENLPKVFFNAEVGVVAYRHFDNSLTIFDRFE